MEVCMWESRLSHVEVPGLLTLFSKIQVQGRRTVQMRGTTVLPVRNILKTNYHSKGAWGMMTTSALKKQGDNNLGEGSTADDKTEQIVAFNKPPLPPFLGPLVALSLLEMGSNGSDRDD